MISKIMNHLKNHFVDNSYAELDHFGIVSDGIVGSFSETYIVGMYLIIRKSYLNDGIYEITGVTSNKLTLDATLNAENTGDTIYIIGSTPPKDFLDLVTDISNFTEKGIGVKSESIDDYSVSYDDDGSWQSVFANKLNDYRRVYDDLRW